MAKVLVTGGAGFLGSNLCIALASKGYSVDCMDDLSASSHVPDGVEFIKADCNDASSFSGLGSYDYVVHYAALVGVLRTEENPLGVLNDLEGIRNVLDFCMKKKVKRFVYASSSEVYGNSANMPNKEGNPLSIENNYSLVKLAGEKLAEAYNSRYGLSTCSLRFFNTYGPSQRGSKYGFVVKKFFEDATSKKPITIFGDGTQTRDFLFVEDNTAAALLALESDFCGVMNIGTGIETSVVELAKKIKDICSSDSEIIFDAPRAHDVRRRVADISLARKEIGFRPKVMLSEGLQRMFKEVRK
jgi:nucleoside-diphosphate-sugar epimerase